MTAACWFCGTGIADPAAAYSAALWGEAKRPPPAEGYAVRAVHRRYVRIDVPVPSCLDCAATRRRDWLGVTYGVVLGAVLAPVFYRLWLAYGPADAAFVVDRVYTTMMVASGIGAAIGLLAIVFLRLVVFRPPPGTPRLRPPQEHPEVKRMLALGWDWESPYSDG